MAMKSESESRAPGRDVYSVSRLNREVRVVLERGLGVLWVEGELSNLSQPPSGHWYFTIKDRDAQLGCVMYRNRNVLLGFTPAPGTQLLLRGRISMFEPRGACQLLVEHLEEAGVGALQRQFERLKTRLAAEGLFAPERRRPLPRFPQRIGVITSPAGAALHDILKVLARRYPAAAVLIYPSAVQGAAAVAELIAAVETAGARAECDVLILARGGGSLEDLWAFNDERLARVICSCPLPLVSGVGHEIDFTIADFVADARAPTPSAAAELVVPDRGAWLTSLARTGQRLEACMRRELRALAARLAAARHRLQRTHPGVQLLQQAQRLDDLTLRLGAAARNALQRKRSRVADGSERLMRCSPALLLREQGMRYQRLEARLERAAHERLARLRHRFELAQRALDAVSPRATLARGYAIVTRAGGALLTDAATVAPGEEIEAHLAHGTLAARVTGRRHGS